MADSAKDVGEEIAPDQEIDFCTMGMFIIGKSGYHVPVKPASSVTVFCASLVLQGLGEKHQFMSYDLYSWVIKDLFYLFPFYLAAGALSLSGMWTC